MAVFATHDLAALGEGFIEGAGQPTAAHFNFTLRHNRRLLLRSHKCLDAAESYRIIFFVHSLDWHHLRPDQLRGVDDLRHVLT